MGGCVFTHEISHMFGAYDLYDYGQDSQGAGAWSLMAYNYDDRHFPVGLDAFTRVLLGWAQPRVVSEDVASTSLSLAPVLPSGMTNSVARLAIPGSSTEYFLVEYRTQTQNDDCLRGAGTLVWHVDEVQLASGYAVNDDQTHYAVDLEEAHGGTQHLQIDRTAGGDYGDPGDPYGTGKATFSSNTDPSSSRYGGASSAVALSGIANGATATMAFSRGATGGTEDDDDVPGVALPASPFNGTLDQSTDVDDVFKVALTAGQKVTFSMTGTGPDFDLYLFKPNTPTVGGDSYTTWGAAASEGDASTEQFTYTAAETGHYYLDVCAATGAGRYQITYDLNATGPTEDDDDVPGVALPASPFNGTLDAATDLDDVFKVALTAGQKVTFSMTGTGPDFDLYLFKPNTPTVGGDSYTTWGVAASEGDASTEQFSYTAAETGTYYLDVCAATGAGAYQITYDLNATGPTEDDDDVPGVALPASPFNGTLDQSTDVDDVFKVALTAGQKVTFSMTGTGPDFDLYLFKPNTPTVGGDSYTTWGVAASEGDASTEQFSYTAAETGTYYLDVCAATGAGSYQITYNLNATGPTDDDDDVPGVALPASPFNGTLDQSTDVDDVFKVELTAGQKVTFSMTGTGPDFDLYLFKPNTPTVGGDSYTTWGVAASEGDASTEQFSYTAAETGTYYLDVCAATGAGSYQITYNLNATGPTDDDDDVPGVALPAKPPVQDDLDADTDTDDVYRVHLKAGQVFMAGLGGPQGADFDLYLFMPGTETVRGDAVGDWIVARSEQSGSEEGFAYQVPEEGDYYLDVCAAEGAGTYTLDYLIQSVSKTTVSSASTISYGQAVTLTGKLTDTSGKAISGRTLKVEALATGSSTWRAVGTRTTSSTGSYSISARPVIRTTYRVTFAGDNSYGPSRASRTVLVRASVSTPVVPSTARRNASVTIYGYLKPRHTSGSAAVRIYAYRYVSGRWRSVGYANAKVVNYSSYSKYVLRVQIGTAGRWRFRAYHGDSGHTGRWSAGYDYLSVR